MPGRRAQAAFRPPETPFSQARAGAAMGLDLATRLRHQTAMGNENAKPPAKQQARLEREAAALRANLARRKVQSRAQAKPADAKTKDPSKGASS